MRAKTQNTDRLDLRLPHEMKERWERAAEITGAGSIASFVKMIVTERADELIREHEMLTLSAEGSAWLLAFLNEPARAPTPAMLEAAQLHRELVKHD